MKTSIKILATSVAGIALVAGVALPAFAQQMGRPLAVEQGNKGIQMPPGKVVVGGGRSNNENLGQVMKNSVAGLVTAVSGNTISVAVHREFGTSTMPTTTSAVVATTTYTIDASNAVILKNNATSTISAIIVGDRIIALGTITGTNVVAKTIVDSDVQPMRYDNRYNNPRMNGTSTNPYQNGGDVVDFNRGQDKDQGQHIGFFAGVGNFFKRMFGFGK